MRREYPVVVVMDVVGFDRYFAHEQVASALRMAPEDEQSLGGYALASAGVVSWWFPEGDVKYIDGNDNPPMRLTSMERLSDAELIKEGVWQAMVRRGPIDDATCRRIASQIHGGQASAMYSLASCGAIDEARLQRELEETYASIGPRDEAWIWHSALINYLEYTSDRGPIEGWPQLTEDHDE